LSSGSEAFARHLSDKHFEELAQAFDSVLRKGEVEERVARMPQDEVGYPENNED